MHLVTRIPYFLAFLAAVASAGWLAGHARAHRPDEIDALLQTPLLPARVMEVLSCGFHSAAADLDYLQAIQLFGDRGWTAGTPAERLRKSQALAKRLDATTDLDPAFNYAYIFGAVAIPLPQLDGSLLNQEDAIRLLRKGVRTGGDDWRVPFHLAYLLTQTGDFAEAAESMAEAARRPGAPAYLPLLATRLAATGGTLDTGIEVARAMAANAETAEQREQLEQRLQLLRMERDLRQIEQAARAFRDAHGRFPQSVEALVAAGFLPAVPLEPHLGRYVLDPESGEARSTGAERLKLSKKVLEEIERAQGRTTPRAEGSP